MDHLSSKRFIHRDLAARNVLLASGKSSTGMVCKVADFGLSRGNGNTNSSDAGDAELTYYRTHTGKFPVRWTAPEAMSTGKYTPASDVWSFGILVVEMLLDGEKPYSAIKGNQSIMQFTTEGGRHSRPDGCSAQLYGLLLECWSRNVTDRPSFANLAEAINGIQVFGVENSHDRQSNVPSSMGSVSLVLARSRISNKYQYSNDSPTPHASDRSTVYEGDMMRTGGTLSTPTHPRSTVYEGDMMRTDREWYERFKLHGTRSTPTHPRSAVYEGDAPTGRTNADHIALAIESQLELQPDHGADDRRPNAYRVSYSGDSGLYTEYASGSSSGGSNNGSRQLLQNLEATAGSSMQSSATASYFPHGQPIRQESTQSAASAASARTALYIRAPQQYTAC